MGRRGKEYEQAAKELATSTMLANPDISYVSLLTELSAKQLSVSAPTFRELRQKLFPAKVFQRMGWRGRKGGAAKLKVHTPHPDEATTAVDTAVAGTVGMTTELSVIGTQTVAQEQPPAIDPTFTTNLQTILECANAVGGLRELARAVNLLVKTIDGLTEQTTK